MSRKRAWQPSSRDTEMAEIWEDLAHHDEEIRRDGVERLQSKLAESQESELLDKVLTRLVRGLCSNRKAARVGFAVALTEVIITYGTIQQSNNEYSLPIPKVLEFLKESTRTIGAVSGQEERDHWLGRIFGAQALIQSKKLFDAGTEKEGWLATVELILDIAQKKPWMREVTAHVLYESVHLLKPVRNGAAFAKVLVDQIHEAGLSKTQEGVALWATCRQNFPDVKLPKNVFPHRDPLHKKELSNLCQILVEGSRDAEPSKEGDAPSKGPRRNVWVARVPFAWDVILKSLLKPEDSQIRFSELWRQFVDQVVFADKSSPERKYLGYKLFQQYVLFVPAEHLPALFQQKFGRSLFNQLTNKDRYLHEIAKDAFEALLSRAKSESAAAVHIATCLLDLNLAFDNRIRPKPIETILRNVKLDGLAAIARHLLSMLPAKTVEDNGHQPQNLSQVITDHLVGAIHSRTYPKESGLSYYRTIISTILGELVSRGFIDTGRTEDQVTGMFRSRIMNCLSSTIDKDPDDPSYHPFVVLLAIRETGEAMPKADAEVATTLSKGWKRLQKLHKKDVDEGKRMTQLRVVKLLLVLAFLQLYEGDVDAVALIEELIDWSKAFLDGRLDETHGLALVELLLSFISKESALYRVLGLQVMSQFTDVVNEEALLALIDVIGAKENTTGLQGLFDKNKDDEDEIMAEATDSENEEQLDVEIDSDVEMVTDDSAPDDSTDDSTSTTSDEEDSEEEQDANDNGGTATDENYAELDAKLEQLLGAPADEGESSDEDMDDEAMEALEPQIAAVFKEHQKANMKQKSKKQDNKDDKTTMVRFKRRVLDLLELFVKEQAHSQHALLVVEPVLQLVKDTSNNQVAQQGLDLLKSFRSEYKMSLDVATHDSSTLDIGRALFKQAHAMAAKEGSKAYWSACSQASLLATKVILNNGGSIDEIRAKYAEAKSIPEIKPSFVEAYVGWFTTAKMQWGYEGEAF